MHVGALVVSENHRDWDRLLAGEYHRPPSRRDSEIVRGTLAVADMIEPLGFDSLFITEHYGSAYSMAGNPLQWLAYWAGRTERVDVGTAVIVAPWWQPVKLATELALLDNLLQGRRLILGIGRGVSTHEYAAFGIPTEESRGRFREMIEILRGFDHNEFFEYHGEYYDIPLTSIRPQPLHKGHLTDTIMSAFNTTASMQQAGELGLGQMFTALEKVDTMSALVRKYNAIRAKNGHAPSQPLAAIFMHCTTDAEAIDRAENYAAQQSWAAGNHYARWNAANFADVKGYEDYAKVFDTPRFTQETKLRPGGPELIGTPEQLYEKIKHLQEATSLGQLLVNPVFGEMTVDEAEKSLRLFSEEVLPAVHDLATPLHDSSVGTEADLEIELGIGGVSRQ